MIYRLKDMRDWSLLNRCIFNNKLFPFSLEQSLLEVKSLALQMASSKNIKINFDTYFEQPEKKIHKNYLDQDMIKANLESCGRTFENHLLLSHMSKVNRRSVLPPQVLGD